MRKLALHWQILLGMVLGIITGLAGNYFGFEAFIADWIYPFGQIFIKSLKMIALPLIVASLIVGITNLKDISKLSEMGGRTIVMYLMTTVIAVIIGLVLVNIIGPGRGAEMAIGEFTQNAKPSGGPLQFLVDMVPSNIFKALTNGDMLPVIVFTLFFGICLLLVKKEKQKPVTEFFDGLNEVVLKMIDIIMLLAAFGVFALLAQVAATQDMKTLFAVGSYMITVVLGLGIMIFAVYPLFVVLYTKRSYNSFFKGIAPAQLLAFSTSSSAATLPLTMERVEEHLGVKKEVSSFVLPMGATINMDGTSLYQAVAAVFIAQVYGIDLTIGNQLTIVLTATMASIGSAAVPGAGLIMLAIVLEAIGVPVEGIALILAVDRLLDMCRTIVNVTGDATVSMVVAKSIGKLGEPQRKDWDDNYPIDKDEE